MMPRITRAQVMDVLSRRPTRGYPAVIEAAESFGAPSR